MASQSLNNKVTLSTKENSRRLHVCRAPLTSDRNAAVTEAFSAQYQAVLLVDGDAIIPDVTLQVLAAASTAYPHCVIGCRTVDVRYRQLSQLPGWRWSPTEGRWTTDWVVELKADPTAEAVKECESLSPEAILVSREIWEAVGPFDSELRAKYAVLDWCRRVDRAGFRCLEARDALVLMEPASAGNYDERIKAYILALPDTLHLLNKWGHPHSRLCLILRLLHQSITEEICRVRFWADYGCSINFPKRTVWYFRNIINALTRERVILTLRHGARSYRTKTNTEVGR